MTLTVGQCATLACCLEATAPKVGNVHRGADFDDLTFQDLLVSAVAIGPAMQQAAAGVGAAVLAAVTATRQLVDNNTNLGLILLLAPLAAVDPRDELRGGVATVLRKLTPDDCRDVYQAIRLASAGGLGTCREMDVHDEPPRDLLQAMRAAEQRDAIARQYTHDFADVFDVAAAGLLAQLDRGRTLTQSIIHTQLDLMSRFPDSLIARKLGPEAARQSADRATAVLAAAEAGASAFHTALADFDFWLRADGHRRNPGTTADLIGAGLFVLLRNNAIPTPFQ